MKRYEDLPRELLKDVLENPDADWPRLAVADWLDTHGDPWARCIRDEVEQRRLFRSGNAAYMSYDRPFPLSEEEIAQDHRWVGPVMKFIRYRSQYLCIRGFCERLTLDAKEFLEHADTIYAMAPIRSVSLENVRPVARELFSSPHLARLSCLDLGNGTLSKERFDPLRDEEIALLAASPYLGKLKWLELAGNEISDAGVEAIAAASTLPNLDRLGMALNPCRSISEKNSLDFNTRTVHLKGPSEFAKELEAKYGYKKWLHSTELSPTGLGPRPIDY